MVNSHVLVASGCVMILVERVFTCRLQWLALDSFELRDGDFAAQSRSI